MSEINDALKRVRQTPPPDKYNGTNPPPLRAEKSPPTFGWMIPAFIVVLIVVAIFFIVWAATHRHVQKMIVAPGAVTPITPVAAKAPIIQPPAAPAPTSTSAPATPPTPAPTAAPALPTVPKLQGIFYSATAPTAILDGKTVGVGDKFGDYHVQHISQDTVTLIAADGREIRIGMKR